MGAFFGSSVFSMTTSITSLGLVGISPRNTWPLNPSMEMASPLRSTSSRPAMRIVPAS